MAVGKTKVQGQTIFKRARARNSRSECLSRASLLAMALIANPFNKESNNDKAGYADDAPNEERPNASEMAVGGIAGAPTPRALSVRGNGTSYESPGDYGERQKQSA